MTQKQDWIRPNQSGQPAEEEDHHIENHLVSVQAGPVSLDGNLHVPEGAKGLVIFAHGSGSLNSPRNQYFAAELQSASLATLLFDLLTPEEEEVDLRTRHLRFDIGLLARRTIGAIDWASQLPLARGLRIGLFGADTGAAAALIAAAERPHLVGAVISQGGRPDLANGILSSILAPVLLITGQLDKDVLGINQQTLKDFAPNSPKKLVIVPGASHLFEEAGAIEYVSRLATDWFSAYLPSEAKQANKG